MTKTPQKTAQRIAIFNYIKDSNLNPSIKDIYQHVSERLSNISLTTVYNTIELLKKEGLIIELPHTTGKEGRRFSSNLTTHDHLICNYCGTVVDMKFDLDRSLLDKNNCYGYDIHTVSLNIYGICPECKTEKDTEFKEKSPEYQIKSSVTNGILEIVLTGEMTHYNAEKMLSEIITIEKSANVEKELIDLRKLEGRLGNAEIFNVVRKYPAHRLQKNIAIVDILANTQLAFLHEAVALNAGFNFKWFKTINTAKAWLKK